MRHKICALSMSLIWQRVTVPLPKKSHNIIRKNSAQAKLLKGFLFGKPLKNLARFVEIKAMGAIKMIDKSAQQTKASKCK